MSRRNHNPPLTPAGEGARPMYLPGIGELTERDDHCWRLVYEACEHIQDLARLGIEDPRDAESSIRDTFVHCSSCQLDARTGAAAD